MSAMVRNCAAAIAVGVALLGGYLWFLHGRLEMPFLFIVALVMALVVWTALVVMNGGRYAWRDWRARNRMARGERPADGELVSAVGEIRAALGVLHSPLRGVPCVAYSYKIGPPAQTSDGPAPDFAGFAMSRCTVHTPYGSFHLASFPMFEGIPEERGDPAVAAQYVASTQFERLDGFQAMVRAMFALHSTPPPFRKDWRVAGEPRIAVEEAELEERVIPAGARVTAVGRYVAASGSIVADLNDQGYLRLSLGGEPRRESRFPGNAVMKIAGGLVVIVAANALLLWVLEQMPR
ncbi:MAG TPA: hypothetical protein VHW00_14785 [Thermoanaerobaculia bacterium]|nr:hypothetical protein [Thermoanaerobaculia bacterium]